MIARSAAMAMNMTTLWRLPHQCLPFPRCHCCSRSWFASSASYSTTTSSSTKKTRNYYEILGVSKDASDEEIKNAYYEKCKEFHPDRHPGAETSTEEFQEIQKAYEALKSQESRKKYNAGQAQTDYDETLREYKSRNDYTFASAFNRRWHYGDTAWHPYESYFTMKDTIKSAQRWEKFDERINRIIFYNFIFGCCIALFYYSIIAYIRYKTNRELDRLDPKEELVNSYMKQREMKDKDSSMQRETVRQLLVDKIDEEERRRKEDPEYRRQRQEEQRQQWMSRLELEQQRRAENRK